MILFPEVTCMKILAVDDKQDILTLVKVILEGDEHTVATAISGEEALTLARQAVFDLVLLDLMMSGMNGFDTLLALREIPKYDKVPIVALTAKAQEGDRSQVLESGFTGYISKPFRAQELIHEVSHYLEPL